MLWLVKGRAIARLREVGREGRASGEGRWENEGVGREGESKGA